MGARAAARTNRNHFGPFLHRPLLFLAVLIVLAMLLPAPGWYAYGGPEAGHTLLGSAVANNAAATSTNDASVIFTETGLPSDTTWSVTMNGSTRSSSTASISFAEPSDIYSFVVGTVNTFASNPQSGYVTVNGTSVTEAITFSSVRSSCAPPSIVLSQAMVSNLTVSINGGTQPGSSECSITGINWQWGDQSASSSFFPASHTYRKNGTFWVIATAHQSDGQTVSTTESVIILAPAPVLPSKITFLETGLPPSTTWSVTSDGLTLSSPSDSISIAEPNGTDAYAVGTTVSGYAPNPEWGYATLQGSAIDLPVRFTPIQTRCPSPSMSINPPIFYSNTTVSVIGSTVPGSSACTITTVYWQWGDGTNSSGIPPGDHTYLYNGTYWIIATTIQSDGQVASATEPITVEQAPPVGNITISVSPRNNTEILVDGNVVSVGASPVVEPIGYGSHNIVAYNPFDVYNSTTVEVSHPQTYVNLSLEKGTGIPGSYYPWSPIGPYKLLLSPPMVPPNGTSQAYAGHLGTMAIDDQNPDIMYVGTGSSAYPTYGPYGDGGIFKTTNHGVTWTPVDFGLPLDIVTSLVMNQSNPQELVAGFWDAGIYKTTDGGGYWFKVANYTLVSGLLDVNGTLFAGTGNGTPGSEGSVIDGPGFGSFWRVVLTTSQEVSAVSASHGYLYAAAGALWKSTDAGRNWTELNSLPNGALFVAASPANPQDLYVYPFAGSSTPYYSNDGGAAFSPVPALAGFGTIVFNPADPEVIWAQGSYSARISFDGGAVWTNGFPTPLGAPVGDIHNTYFVPTENGTIFALSDQGIFYTKNFGRTWYPDSGDLYNFLVYGFGVGNGGSQIIAAMQDYGGPQTHDGGLTWSFGNLSASTGVASGAKVSTAGIGEGSITFTNPGNSSWTYAFDPGSQTLIVSRDSGLTFYPVLDLLNVTYRGNPPMFDSLFAVSPSNTSRVYLGTSLGIFNGTNYGATWELWPGSPSNVSAVWTSPDGTIFVSWGDSHLSYYVGGAWLQSEGVDFTVASMTFDPAQPSHVLIASNQEPSGSIYVSVNSGVSFSLLNPSPIQFAYAPPPQEGYGVAPLQLFYLNTSGDPLLGITDEGVYLSQDGGTEWTNIDYNLQSGQVTWAAYANQTLFLSTFGEGILRWKGFAVATLPGTILGNVSDVAGLNVTVNGIQVPAFEGHFVDYVPPGNYTVILRWLGGSKTYIVSLAPESVYRITYAACTGADCTVGFAESGLPSGTVWSVTLNGVTESSSTPTITFEDPNGTYSYTIADISGWHQTTLAYVGTITVNGSIVIEPTLQFTQTTYSVMFTETGLPPGTEWWVNLTNGQSFSGTGTTINFSEPNGTYLYAIAAAGNVYQGPGGGFSVAGKPVTQPVAFSRLFAYPVDFSESGLPSSTSWSVDFGGTEVSSTSPSITFMVRNGTAGFVVGTVAGYNVTPESGYLTVSGASVAQSIDFTAITSPFGPPTIGLGPAAVNGLSVTINGGTCPSSGCGSGPPTIVGVTWQWGDGTNSSSYFPATHLYGAPGTYWILVTTHQSDGQTASAMEAVKLGYTVQFSESGLPSGTTWSVMLNGQALSSTTSTITFAELNGTYPYSVNSRGWQPSPATGSVTVNGASVSQAVTFTQVAYTVTFTESGLPTGTAWWVNITAGPNGYGVGSYAGTGSSIGVSLVNGSYSYSVATVNKAYCAHPATGLTARVNGGPALESVAFSPYTYPVTFSETGLPSGTEWYVNGTSGPNGFPLPSESAGSGSAIGLDLVNGTYRYTVETNDRAYKAMETNALTESGGSPATVSVTFTQVTYAVTFTETGLPSGTSWSVTLNGVLQSSTTDTLTFPEPNGSYAYTIGDVAGWHQTSVPYSGSVTVNGAAVTEPTLAFTQVTYAVTFTETGLPSGTSWSVTLNGAAASSTTSTIAFAEPNGTYGWSIANVPGWHISSGSYSGSSTANGTPVTVATAFTQVTYTVTFTETGLPSGTSWSVTVNGTTQSTVGSTITFSEPNGTYSFTVSSPGYRPGPGSGSLTVNGAAMSQAVTFTQVTYPVTFTESGLPSGTSWSVTVSGVTHTSTTGSVAFTEPNGSYIYGIADVSGWHQTTLPYSGSVTVNGAAVTEPTLAFTPVTYAVTFTETGLLSGTSWSVTLNGAAASSTTSTIAFAEPNGTYGWSIANVPGWHISSGAYSGSSTANGTPVTVATTFTQVTYAVTFTESGLAAGTSWQVNISGGAAHSSTTATISFSEPNGSYTLTLWTAANYTATSSPLTLTITGTANGASVVFVRTYGVTFDRPAGTPAGASWTVYLNGTSPSVAPPGTALDSGGIERTTAASTLTIMAPNGSYEYSIVVGGNPSLTNQGTVNVHGSNVVANPPPRPATFLGFSGLTGYYILGAIVTVVIVVAVLAMVLRGRGGKRGA